MIPAIESFKLRSLFASLIKIALTAILPASYLCFKPITVSEQNREIPSWTSYKYLEAPHKDTLVREYVLQEQDQRTYLMCPRGFAIAQVAVSLLLGQDHLNHWMSSRLPQCSSCSPGDPTISHDLPVSSHDLT